MFNCRIVRPGDPCREFGIAPDRLAVLAPVQREGPARQAFAGIPLALAVMQEAIRREALLQAANEIVGAGPLGRPDGGRIPFRGLKVVDRNEGRFAAHGKAHVVRHQIAVDGVAERVEFFPGFVGEWLGDARRFVNAVDAHVESEFAIGDARGPGNRRGGDIMRRRRQRDVAFAAQQAGGDVKADPAGTRNVDFGPGVQIAEILVGALRALERIDVGLELDQIAGDEAGGEAEIAHDLHQQPGGVAARAAGESEGLFRRLNARTPCGSGNGPGSAGDGRVRPETEWSFVRLWEAPPENRQPAAPPAPGSRRRKGRQAGRPNKRKGRSRHRLRQRSRTD